MYLETDALCCSNSHWKKRSDNILMILIRDGNNVTDHLLKQTISLCLCGVMALNKLTLGGLLVFTAILNSIWSALKLNWVVQRINLTRHFMNTKSTKWFRANISKYAVYILHCSTVLQFLDVKNLFRDINRF